MSEPTPVIVATGVLTRREYESLDSEQKMTVEMEADRLQRRYGADWLRTNKLRLRDELSFAYGI